MLVKYLRDGKRPIGCVVAVDREHIGLSICNPKDKFSKKHAVELAVGRAMLANQEQFFNLPNRLISNPEAYNVDEAILIPLDQYVESELYLMENRAKRYFK